MTTAVTLSILGEMRPSIQWGISAFAVFVLTVAVVVVRAGFGVGAGVGVLMLLFGFCFTAMVDERTREEGGEGRWPE